MKSILKEIEKIRESKPISIDYKNNNRYRVLVNENDGTKTAYYFSCPIYNSKTRKVVDFKFYQKDGAIYSFGSNSSITFSNSIRMENNEGYAEISLENVVSPISINELASGNQRIYPTVNGFVYKINCINEKSFTFSLEVGKPFMEVRANNKCFSLMSERFRPFITLSCIGTTDEQSNIIVPARISYQKISDKKYSVTVSTCSPIGKWILLEANLYEAKLIQDTTVESMNPSSNNAFGSSAFIGNTSEYGEQWLYSRPDFDKLSDLDGKKILRAILHLPNHNHNNVELECFRVSARFCSFGSNWENKISASNYITDLSINSKYQSINLTDLVTDKFGNLTRSDGFIVRTKNKNSGFSVVSTGDSYYAPQILEINFK